MPAKPSGNPIPILKHKKLLQAALLSNGEKLKAYSDWKSMVDFETEVEHASQKLLPLLYHNLKGDKIEDALITRLKGIYRKKWSENNLFFYQWRGVLELLKANNIRVIVLKGVPMVIQYYKNMALRSMADIDLMVLRDQRKECVELVLSEGYTIKENAPVDYLLRTFRSITLVKDGLEVDLHWSPLLESFGLKSEQVFWEKAIAINVLEIPLEAFCPTDQLFHILIHGYRYNPEPPIRWIADATMILRSGEEIYYERLWNLSKQHGVIMQARAALIYLEGEFEAEIPHHYLNKFKTYKPSLSERILFNHAVHKGWQFDNPTGFVETVKMHYFIHLRQSIQYNFLIQHLSFIAYTVRLFLDTPVFFVSRFTRLFFNMFR